MAASGKIFLCALRILAVVSLFSLASRHPFGLSKAKQLQRTSTSSRELRSSGIGASSGTRCSLASSRVPGDPYSEDAVRRDFQALWNTQFFEDIRLEVEDDPNNPNGKIVVFYVTERPDHSPHRIQGQQIDLRVGHSRRVQGQKGRAFGREPVRSHQNHARRSGDQGPAGRARPSVRHGKADLRAHRRDQRGEIGFQHRRRARR